MGLRLQRAAVKCYQRHHRLTTSPPTPQVSWPFWTGLVGLETFWGATAFCATWKWKAMMYHTVCKRVTLKCSQSTVRDDVQSVVCYLNERQWGNCFRLGDVDSHWLKMKWYEFGLLLKKIKEMIVVSSGQAGVLVLMNIALCLMMFYKVDALTVLYISNESESLN